MSILCKRIILWQAYFCLIYVHYSYQENKDVLQNEETGPGNVTHIASSEGSAASEDTTVGTSVSGNINSTTFDSEVEDGYHSESSVEFNTITHSNRSIDDVLENKEEPSWYKDSIKDIAYYLRAHKFNEYDRRYNRNGTNVERTNFQYFPKPPLRSLHWEVHRYCEPSFLQCVEYLGKKLKHVALRRQDDTSIVAQENNWGSNSTRMVSQIDMECRRMKKIDNEIAAPFEGPLERYQWRATASYFMCWYTMNEIPDLKHLGENCDNFAFCLDMSTGPNNEDIRANDTEPFSCAQYSDIILNRWNVSCKCSQEGYEWSSLYGICVDIDECTSSKLHDCVSEGQACLNLPGGFTCVCKWGYYYNEKAGKCITSDVVSHMKMDSTLKEQEKNKKNRWKEFMKATLRIIGKTSSSNTNKLSLVVLVICFFKFLLRHL